MQAVGLKGAQMNLFRPKELSALPGPAQQRRIRKRPIQHEKKFMADIMRVAHPSDCHASTSNTTAAISSMSAARNAGPSILPRATTG